MKRFISLLLSVVMAGSLFSGCKRRVDDGSIDLSVSTGNYTDGSTYDIGGTDNNTKNNVFTGSNNNIFTSSDSASFGVNGTPVDLSGSTGDGLEENKYYSLYIDTEGNLTLVDAFSGELHHKELGQKNFWIPLFRGRVIRFLKDGSHTLYDNYKLLAGSFDGDYCIITMLSTETDNTLDPGKVYFASSMLDDLYELPGYGNIIASTYDNGCLQYVTEDGDMVLVNLETEDFHGTSRGHR